MCKAVPFNMNDHVRVKLTDRGRELLRLDHAKSMGELAERLPLLLPAEDEDGYGRWQLWDLMQTFGKHIHLGCQMPFDTEILVETQK